MELLVSIVTVSLNSAATIRDTLESVKCQRAPFQIEHICIDGGSTDGTRDIILCGAESQNELVTLFEPDRGLFDAMNKGLHLARGRFVLFLNADDYLISSTSVADAFSQISLTENEPDMVMSDVVMARPGIFGVWRMRRVPRWLPRFLHIGAHPPHQGNFISRNLLISAGGFDAEQRLASDTTQFYRLVFEHPVRAAVSRTTLSFMRMGGASNKNMVSFLRGNIETYKYLRRSRTALTAALIVSVKLVQKLFEYRLGNPSKQYSNFR